MALRNIPRIGFACKYMDPDQTQHKKLLEEIQRPLNTKSTTVQWLNRQSREVAEQRLWDIMSHNIESYRKLVEYVGGLPDHLHMVRLGSDCLPVYTHYEWSYFWQRTDVRAYCEQALGKVGELARSLDVRLSFHPGPFTVLASDNDDIVHRSIEELEYHADMIRWMGYGQKFQDFKCNVHIAGRRGAQGIIDVYGRLSPEARNTITIENEEMKHGLDDCLVLTDYGIPIVLDVHHNWVREGEYITPADPRCQRILDAWRGVRPVIHYSVSREDYLVGHSTTVAPDYAALLESGHKKSKLRAHSDFYWNEVNNDWVLEFLDTCDIMCESKGKNIASFALYERAKERGLV